MGHLSTLDITREDAKTYILKAIETASDEQIEDLMDVLYYPLHYNFSIEEFYGKWRREKQFLDYIWEFDNYLEEKYENQKSR